MDEESGHLEGNFPIKSKVLQHSRHHSSRLGYLNPPTNPASDLSFGYNISHLWLVV